MIVAVADTHAAIWYLYNDVRLSKTADEFIQKAAHEGDQIGLSSITFIEMVYLIEKGRIPVEGMSRLARALDEVQSMFAEIPVDLSIARALSRIDVAKVPDMPDRIIAATGMLLGVPIISRDAKIQLSGLPAIW
jgi:PIN domain nuclease of toxin-antitoxin system